MYVLTAAHCLNPGQIKSITVITSFEVHDRMYSVEKYLIHPGFRTKQSPARDLAVLKTARDIQFSDKVQQIEVDFRKISNNLPAIKMDYSRENVRSSFRLKYAFTRVTVCIHMYSLICSLRGKNKIVRLRGGPLVSCRDGFTECSLIGVAGSHSRRNDFFVSTRTNNVFITTSLNTQFFRGCAVRDSGMSKLFVSGLSFFTIILIAH